MQAKNITSLKENMSKERETLASRIGFILLSVGCAVGLGNVWRFPFIVGQYGGAIFVLLYLISLVLLGFPVLVMELAIGRAGRLNLVGSYRRLSGGSALWTNLARLAFLGNVVLMMYYTTVSGWLMAYAKYYLTGSIMECRDNEAFGAFFGGLVSSPGRVCGYMLLSVFVGTLLCAGSLRNTVERSVKYMMAALFVLMGCLVIMAFQLPGAREGLRFYLVPNIRSFGSDIVNTIFAAMGQAFFTLSLGVGSMAIFGSYLDDRNKRSLGRETGHIIFLDTLVALCAGLIIFPICSTFGVDVGQGPSLIFVSLPALFEKLGAGRFWGSLFFIFMAIAALTTIVAVFENMVAYLIDELHFKRGAAAATVGVGIGILSLPCALGFNVLSAFKPLGEGTCVLDLEDFIVSQNLLPLGALLSVIFCTVAGGWGWKKFTAEAEEGQKAKYGSVLKIYCRYVLPLLVIAIFVLGYLQMFTNVLE